MRARAAGLLAGCLIAGFLAFAVHELPRYGPTFDAVLGEYPYGEDFLAFYTSLDPDHLRFTAPPPHSDEPGHPAFERVYPLSWIYPFGATLSAAGCAVFARGLGWLDAVDAHHLICPLAFAALLLLVYRFVVARLGAASAIAAMLSLLLQPRLLGEALNNVKDAPTLPLFFGALFLFARALERDRVRPLIGGLIVTGVGLTQKINAVWPLLFFALVFAISRGRGLVRGDVNTRRMVLGGLASLPLVGVAYFTFAPQYLVDPGARLADHWLHRTEEATRVAGRDYWSFEPLMNLAITTPPIVLALALFGAIAMFRRRVLAPTTLVLLLCVLVIPPLRPCLPGMRYFNVVRHFLETLVVMGIFAGHGATELLRMISGWIEAPRARRVATGLCTALLVAPGVFAVAATHPFETTYYNAFVGGLGGAQKRGLADANDYWCQSYREGLRWLNGHADHGALLIVPVAPWMVGPVKKLWLRDDLRFSDNEDVTRAMLANGLTDPDRDHARWRTEVPAVFVMYAPLSLRYNHQPDAEIVRFCETRLTPCHVLSRDGGEILRFYRFEP